MKFLFFMFVWELKIWSMLFLLFKIDKIKLNFILDINLMIGYFFDIRISLILQHQVSI
jgi:hypothetical protein